MKLKLDGWKLGINFSACHFLPGHDKCNRLHGHNYAVHMQLEGEPGDDGIIYDFVALKKAIKSSIEELDHCILMPGKSDIVSLEISDGQVMVESLGKKYSFPECDVRILDLEVVSAEMLALYLLDKMVNALETNQRVKEIVIGIDEGAGQGAWASRRL